MSVFRTRTEDGNNGELLGALFTTDKIYANSPRVGGLGGQCAILIRGTEVIAKCLSDCFVRSSLAKRRLKLKTFIAGRNRLEVPGAVALAEAFTKIGSLEEFAVPQNGITAKGVEALAACFKANPNLRVINLNDNTATQLGSAAIAETLPSLPKLEVLNLGDCLCRDQGCHAIVDALSPTVHKALKEVDLSGAELSGAAAMRIVDKWKKFPSSTRLIISSNNFGHVFEQLRATAAGKYCTWRI
ncbi:hypothetical protein COOONC_11822 [Cooperia oncophora]